VVVVAAVEVVPLVVAVGVDAAVVVAVKGRVSEVVGRPGLV